MVLVCYWQALASSVRVADECTVKQGWGQRVCAQCSSLSYVLNLRLGGMSLSRVSVVAYVGVSTSAPVTTAGPALFCNMTFEGGNWLLVRRVVGSAFHPSIDHLAGSDSYGAYGGPTSNSTFSIEFAWLLNSTTEFLFMTGV